MHYHVIDLDESSTQDDLKNDYRKLSLQSQPDKNKHQQDSAAFRMINGAKEGLEDVLRYNYAMRRNQEKKEDLQR